MHHNDNWPPQIRALRCWLMRMIVASASTATAALMIAWVGLLVYVVHAAAVATMPVLSGVPQAAGYILQWILSRM